MTSKKMLGAVWHHAAMSVRDMGRSLGFYRDVLGFEVLWEIDHVKSGLVDLITGLTGVDVHMAMLSGYGTRLEFFQYHSPQGTDSGPKRQCDLGLTHICIFVEDVRGEYERLSGLGVEFIAPPQNHRPDGWVTYMKDPDGVVIELLNPGPTG